MRGVGDPRLAVTCNERSSGMAVVDRRHAGAVGQSGRRRIVRRSNGAALTKNCSARRTVHRRQVARLASTLPLNGAARLERAARRSARRSACSLPAAARGLILPMAATAILVTAAESIGRTMPLPERLQRLVEGIDAPIAAFARDGTLVGASEAARPLPGFEISPRPALTMRAAAR